MSSRETYKIYTKPSCPWGKKAIDLLQERGSQVVIHKLTSDEEVTEFKKLHGVTTTPQIFSGKKRIGGYSDLAEELGEPEKPDTEKKSYIPVIAVFTTALGMSLATWGGVQSFMGYSLCILATLKLMDLSAFSDGFKNYDLIAKALPKWGHVYPFLELIAGLGFLSGSLPALTGGIAFFAGTTGGISVYKAVFMDKKDLNCACIGGNSRAPLGLVSLSENVVMAGMGAILLGRGLL